MKFIYSIILVFVFFTLKFTAQCQDLYQVSSININTREYIEEYPVYYKGGIVFITNRAQSALWKYINQDGQPLKDIFYSKQRDNKKWAAPDDFSKILNTRVDELSVCFDSTGRTCYFTRIEGERSAIYSATFNGREWTNVNQLPFCSSYRSSNFYNPALSADGKRLFVSSNRPGGQGGSDIWVSALGRNGWGTLKNLGPMVNSDTSDYAPFYHLNGKLYFASSRKGSLGGADIFWTVEINGKWLPAKSLPSPMNTKYDDYSYISDSADRRGFISSYRNRSEDIYSFVNSFPLMDNPKAIQKNTYKFRFRETSIISDSSTYIYEWDFGDGTKIRGRDLNVVHIFPRTGDYLVALNVIDSLTGEMSLNQSTNLVPVRDEIQPVISCTDTVYVNEEVQFDSYESYLPEFKSPEFYWDFGDGTLEKGKTPKHAYYYPGKYRIVLGSADKKKDQNITDLLSVFKTIIVIERKKIP